MGFGPLGFGWPVKHGVCSGKQIEALHLSMRNKTKTVLRPHPSFRFSKGEGGGEAPPSAAVQEETEKKPCGGRSEAGAFASRWGRGIIRVFLFSSGPHLLFYGGAPLASEGGFHARDDSMLIHFLSDHPEFWGDPWGGGA